MKKKAIFITALLVGLCAVNLYWYRKELGLYWREWSSFQRHFISFNSQALRHQPILSHSVSKQDPEAAAIVEFIYQSYSGRDHKVFLREIEQLSEFSEKYPDNPYFLYEIACRLTDYTYVDPQIIALIADRLIEIDPNNGRYYFLKAMAILCDWGDTQAEDALAYLEKCYSCPVMQDPYERYKARACLLVEKDKMTAILSGMAVDWRSKDWGIWHQFRRNLLSYTQDLIINSQADKAMQIHDQFQRIVEKSLPEKIESIWEYPFINSLSYIGLAPLLEDTPQALELKWMNPDPKRAKHNRMQLLGWKQWNERFSQERQKMPAQATQEDYHGSWKKLIVPPAAHSFQITIAAFIAFLFFGAVGVVWKMQPSRFSRWIFLLAPLFIIGYFLFCRWGDYQLIYNGIMMCDHYTFDCVPVPRTIFIFLCLINYCAQYSYLLWLLIPTAGILAWVYVKKEARFGWFRKLILRLLAIILILIVWSAWNRLKLGSLGLDILALTFLLPVLCIRKRDKKAGIYYHLFSRSAEAMQYRRRCLVLCGSVVLIHLAAFTLSAWSLANFTAYSIQHEFRYRIPVKQTIFVPRYTIEPNDYDLLLSEFKTEMPWDMRLPYRITLVEPADIPGVVTTLKEGRKNDPNGRWGGMGMPGMPKGMPVIGGQTPKMPNQNRDYLPELRFVAEHCGKDALPYIKPFLKDPNVTDALAIRECNIPFVGREVLIGQWQSLFDNWRSDPNRISDMDCGTKALLMAMANLSPYPNFPMGDYPFSKKPTPKLEMEIGAFSNYLLEHNVDGRINDDMMMYLDRRQKGEVLAAMVCLLNEKPLHPRMGQGVLEYNAELDTATRERLWKDLLDNCNKSDSKYEHEYQTLKNKPFDYHISDELLVACMNSENVCLRAMGQHICRKLGKTSDAELLKCWVADSSPVVRAGAVLLSAEAAAWAEPTLRESAEDSSPFVRLVRGLGGQVKREK
jgi:hypothetical protein